MIVPIAKSSPGQSTAVADMPSETNMLLALGIMHKNGYFDTAQLDDAQKAFRDIQYGTKDQPNQAMIDKLDLNHAVPESGKEIGGEDLVPWRDQVIDVNKLSPKELKAIGR